MKTSAEIRADFLEFFRNKNHQIVPSAPIIALNDPTLLFTNAGMNQFKDVFLGTGKRSYRRVANTQKCLRVSGKHNDLEVVGRDSYHHTFFEMLGNWSFGDYFKKEAIAWSWELLTTVWKIPKDKLWATVFGGDAKDGLESDKEAFQFWESETDINPDHILEFGKKENFWEMGETGPCGPCTEIHIDRGSVCCDKSHILGHVCQVNGDCGRYIEIWNLVFMQFNRQEDQSLVSLPAKHVDTGMGFERIVSVLHNKHSNYETDIFTPIIKELEKITGKIYKNTNSPQDVSFRVISDHIRALSSTFADGALPGNVGRGYVLRRILRRAARFGRQYLGMEEPFIYRLVPVVAQMFDNVFPEIQQRAEHLQLLIRTEEEAFGQMLTRGIRLFEDIVKDIKAKGGKVFPGDTAYRLYQQDGFPKDLVELMARDESLEMDEKGWEKAQAEHIARSKGKTGEYLLSISDVEGFTATKFLGYDMLESSAKLVKIIDHNKLILDQTPFYAQSGGQVGDTGIIFADNFQFQVMDTQKFGDIIIHFGESQKQDLSNMPKVVTARVDCQRRKKIMANHTATHLLHAALRKILGSHVAQQGSIVEPDRLRFDISHPRKITDDELYQVECLVNEYIYRNATVQKTQESMEDAKAHGAIALFGEKYGDIVRVVQIGDYSSELCGGTHTDHSGDLGYFHILSESAIQAGVRRIEATTRDKAVEEILNQQKILKDIKAQLKVNETEILPRIIAMQEEIKELRKKETLQIQKNIQQQAKEIVAEAQDMGKGKIITAKVENIPGAELRILADAVRQTGQKLAGMILSQMPEQLFFVIFVSPELTKELGIHAGQLMKEIGPILGGGGNPNRADFSQGQGTKMDNMDSALEKMQKILQEKFLA